MLWPVDSEDRRTTWILGQQTKTHTLYVLLCGLWQVLNFMWLKFLLIWRFFRFWALVSADLRAMSNNCNLYTCNASSHYYVSLLQIDGIETQENMIKCLNNCCDLETFWKSWHASYNRYLVRYCQTCMETAEVHIIFLYCYNWPDEATLVLFLIWRYLYIPLGGSQWRFLNVWIIFTFVAIWHDLEWWVCFKDL